MCTAIILFVLQARLGKRLAPPPQDLRANTGGHKSLGGKKSRGFIPPFRRDEENDDRGSGAGAAWSSGGAQGGAGAGADIEVDERLKNIDPKLVELITNEMLNRSPNVKWCDIAGLDFAKQSVQEIVVWPMLRPDIFTGLRGPPKGLLLFGPPGAIIFIRILVHRRLTRGRHRQDNDRQGNSQRKQLVVFLHFGVVPHVQMGRRGRENGSRAVCRCSCAPAICRVHRRN